MAVDRRGFLSLAAAGWSALGLGRASAEGWSLPWSSGDAEDSLARGVHRDTRNTRAGAIGRKLWPPGGTFTLSKPYPGRPRIELPAPSARGPRDAGPLLHEHASAAAGVRAFARESLALGTLARLLHLTNGVTKPGRVPLRAAPSAGALYAGEVYVVAARVDGLEPGVYSYHVPSHALVRLESEDDALERVAEAVTGSGWVRDAPFALLLANVFGRYTGRYANRGYRYALIDNGHVGENLRIAASAEGLATCSPRRFRDALLNDLLELDGRGEAVCALHLVGRRAPDHGDEAHSAGGPGWVEAHRREDFHVDPGASAPERYHAATALVAGPVSRGSSPGDPTTAPEPAATGSEGIVLPHRDPPRASVSWVIRERRSAMRFENREVAGEDLAWLLDLCRGDAASETGIELRVAAHRIAGLASGIYALDAGARRLRPIRSGDVRAALRRACGGQEKAGTAAAGVALLADLTRTDGGRDRIYRDLLLEAGAAAQRLYLGAEALGLAARNLAAFFDDELNALLGAEDGRLAVVHLTMVGAGN